MKKGLFYLFFPIVLGSIVGLLINSSFDDLITPVLTPPKIVFPIVWSIIYLLMGISYFIFKRNSKNNSKESFVYYLQLFVNILWSFIFFVFKLRFLAVIWIILLDVLVAYMIYLFYQKVKISAYLNIPYMIWILFASYLTVSIYILN